MQSKKKLFISFFWLIVGLRISDVYLSPSHVDKLPKSSDIVADVAEIVSQSRRLAYAAVDVVLLQRNWLIGKRIAEEELKDSRKENYGLEIIETLSKELSKEFGKGFDKVNLYYYLRFFKAIQTFFTQRVNNLSPAGAIPYDLICGNGVPIWA
ncbi:MAG: hypothetical protein IJS52_08720 [Bacilli bacterium]|nr:hypothetical protein [Bacilli bacterium]